MRLSVQGLRAGYGSSQVLFGMDMHVADGETVALIGRNGAGKTTTLHCVMGVLGSRQGSIEVDGAQTIRLSPHRIARLGVALVPQGRRVFSELTVEENLRTGISLDGDDPLGEPMARSQQEGSRQWGSQSRRALDDGRAVRGLSLAGQGQEVQGRMVERRRAAGPVDRARSDHSTPGCCCLDEPTEGLAPRVVETLTEQLLRIKASGLTIVLAEQHLGLVRELASRAYVIDRGLVRAEGEPGALLADEQIRHAYLSL